VGFLHNRATARDFGVPPTGNGRRLNYRNTPTMRLTNFRVETSEKMTMPHEGWFRVEWRHIVCDPNTRRIEGALTAYEHTAGQGPVLLPRLRVNVGISDLLTSVRIIRDGPQWYTTASIEGRPILVTMSHVDVED